MNNLLHLRLVEPISKPDVPQHGSWEPGSSVTGDEEDIEAMLSDPVSDLVRDMDRLIARQGPLPPDAAVRATLRVAQAVIHDGEIRRYAVTTTHVLWLGSVLYFALTGAAPLAPREGAPSPSRPPPMAALSIHSIALDIERIVATCLSPERRERFHSVTDLESALAALPEAVTAAKERPVVEAPPEREDEDVDGERPTVPPASGITVSKMASAPLPGRRHAGGTRP